MMSGRSNRKRAFSVLLALCLTFGILGGQVFAADKNTVYSFEGNKLVAQGDPNDSCLVFLGMSDDGSNWQNSSIDYTPYAVSKKISKIYFCSINNGYTAAELNSMANLNLDETQWLWAAQDAIWDCMGIQYNSISDPVSLACKWYLSDSFQSSVALGINFKEDSNIDTSKLEKFENGDYIYPLVVTVGADIQDLNMSFNGEALTPVAHSGNQYTYNLRIPAGQEVGTKIDLIGNFTQKTAAMFMSSDDKFTLIGCVTDKYENEKIGTYTVKGLTSSDSSNNNSSNSSTTPKAPKSGV